MIQLSQHRCSLQEICMQSYSSLDHFCEDNASLESMLVCLQDKNARLKALAVLWGPIQRFPCAHRPKIGDKTWSDLAGDLLLECSPRDPVSHCIE